MSEDPRHFQRAERRPAPSLNGPTADITLLPSSPDVHAEELAVVSHVALSTRDEARLPRTWIALLRGRVRASLAATSGVENSEDVAAYLLAGADVVMTASALLRHGPEFAAVLLDGLTAWMGRKGFESVDDFRGMFAVPADGGAAEHERAAYVRGMRSANTRTQGPWG